MENVSIKLEKEFFAVIERAMRKNGYATKTEFIREALRDKIEELEEKEMLKAVNKLFGSSKHSTTEKDLHKARERLVKRYERRFG